MSAGKPNFQKLYEMGKLPDSQRHQIPGLLEKDEKEAEARKKAGNVQIEVKCPVEKCEYVAKGTQAQTDNRLKLHAKSHVNKETK